MSDFESIQSSFHAENAALSASVAGEMPELPEEVDNQVLDAYLQVREGLMRYGMERTAEARTFELAPGEPAASQEAIVGVAIGVTEGLEEGLPGDSCVVLYTSEPMPAAQAMNQAAAAFEATAFNAAATVPTRVVYTGEIELQSHTWKLRPAAPGSSVGRQLVTAGTFGCLARGTTPDRRNRLLMLSNNHVLAAVNAGRVRDDIVQPGLMDRGQLPGDKIGALERFVRIEFTRPNQVDCATALVDPALVRPEFMYAQGSEMKFFSISPAPVPATRNMVVGKTGRTTRLTRGVVKEVGATIQVNMGRGRVATFANQIAVQGTEGLFSRGGDSGSLVWTWNRPHHPVGLLFAGGNNRTFLNPIQTVLSELQIELVVAQS